VALKTGGGLETTSLVLEEKQVEALRALRDERRKSFTRFSLSDAAREVVAAGLDVIHGARHSDSVASQDERSAA